MVFRTRRASAPILNFRGKHHVYRQALKVYPAADATDVLGWRSPRGFEPGGQRPLLILETSPVDQGPVSG